MGSDPERRRNNKPCPAAVRAVLKGRWPEPINEMLSAIDRHDGTLWAMPVVSGIESRAVGSVVDFVIMVIAAQVGGIDQNRAVLVERWLSGLRAMISSQADRDILTRASRDIWYEGLSRDELQTAIAGLYAAVASLNAGNYPGYLRESEWRHHSGDERLNGHPLPDRLRHLIELFPDAIDQTVGRKTH